MYQSPRGLKKLNVIDEGWKLLDFKNEKVGQFIEKGYRTARRHTGAYITITQNIVDFDSPTASSAARAAWGNSSYKAILKQSAKEFAKYNQLYPDQFSKLEKDMINGFGSAKEQWFSSFYAAGGSELLLAPPVRRPAQPGDVLLQRPGF